MSCLPVVTLKIGTFMGRSRRLPSKHLPCELSLTLQQGTNATLAGWHSCGGPSFSTHITVLSDHLYTLLMNQTTTKFYQQCIQMNFLFSSWSKVPLIFFICISTISKSLQAHIVTEHVTLLLINVSPDTSGVPICCLAYTNKSFSLRLV